MTPACVSQGVFVHQSLEQTPWPSVRIHTGVVPVSTRSVRIRGETSNHTLCVSCTLHPLGGRPWQHTHTHLCVPLGTRLQPAAARPHTLLCSRHSSPASGQQPASEPGCCGCCRLAGQPQGSVPAATTPTRTQHKKQNNGIIQRLHPGFGSCTCVCMPPSVHTPYQPSAATSLSSKTLKCCDPSPPQPLQSCGQPLPAPPASHTCTPCRSHFLRL